MTANEAPAPDDDAVASELSEVSCETCIAACCKAPTRIWLSRPEYKKLGPSMKLKEILPPRQYPQRMRNGDGPNDFMPLPAGVGVYMFDGACANLGDDNRCTIYTKRPGACREFAVGSPGCLSARHEAGLDQDRPWVEPTTPVLTSTERLVSEYFAGVDTDGSTPLAEVVLVEPLGLTDVRASVERDMRWINEVLARCDANAWLRRTRCAEWNVGQLATHLVTDLHIVHNVLTAAAAGRGAAIPPEFVGDRATVVTGFTSISAGVRNALAGLAPDTVGRDVRLGGEDVVGVQNVLQVMTMELAVHSLDFAAALGETRHLTSDAARATAHVLPEQLHPGTPPRGPMSYVLRSLLFELPFSWRGNTWVMEPGPDPCYIEGDVEAVLLFALGREPFSTSRLSTNDVDRARAFKRHLRGP